MTREIKFRGKRLDNGEWVYGDLIHFADQTCAIVVIPFSKYGYTATELSRMDQVDPDTVGQYTGLKDRNGREIYEDDLFKPGYYNTIFRVEWDKENARYIGREKKGSISYVGREPAIEVRGNIYDNPELLNE